MDISTRNANLYDISRYFYVKNGVFDILVSDDLILKIKSVSYIKEIHQFAGSLDEVAFSSYGEDMESAWWIIAIYNDIINPYIVSNIDMKIPNLAEVDDILIDTLEHRKINSK